MTSSAAAGSWGPVSAPARDAARRPPPGAESAEDARRILARWLIGLRWAVFLFLAATLPFGETLFGFHVRYAIAAPLLGGMLAWNAFTHRRLAAGAVPSARAVAVGVGLDLAAIGGILAASGGAANPFSVVFVVHVALAASLLPARTTYALAGLAVCLFASLFAVPSGGCCPNHPANAPFSAHLYGMWLAFVVAAGLVSYFLTRVRGALDDREREITRLRQKAEESARFAALGTLAAGTAHELCTPLGTIAVLAGEIAGGAAEADQGASILAQVGRCRDILTRMQAGGSAAREAGAGTAIGAAVRRGVAAWQKAHPDAPVALRERSGARRAVGLAAEDVEAALCALLDNALHASRAAGSDEAIGVEIAEEDGAVLVRVEDGGEGVAPALEGRLGEPFLTTKEPGEGMGLGLYLIRALLERVGGRLEVSAREPRGTRVTLRLAPAA
jgi:two-component system, sensor histidine kinase RegB